MLYQKCSEAPLLELIKSLQNKKYLQGFCLVRGTAMTLHLDHRESDVIDLFSNIGFYTSLMPENIHQDYPFQILMTAANTLKGSIHDSKVVILAHRYSYIQEPVTIDGMVLLSKPGKGTRDA